MCLALEQMEGLKILQIVLTDNVFLCWLSAQAWRPLLQPLAKVTRPEIFEVELPIPPALGERLKAYCPSWEITFNWDSLLR